MPYYAGVDLGATNVRAAVVGGEAADCMRELRSRSVADGDGTVLETDRRPTPEGPSGIAVTEAVLAALRAACERAGIRPDDVRAVGIGSIGPLDLAEGTVVDPANLPPAIDRIPLVGPIQELVATDRVYLHNDTSAGVIGERFFSDRNPDDMVYLTISSGIGAGVTVDGNVVSGWDGNAGEVGHMVVDPDGSRTCGCGRDGHWEAYCSGENLPGYARELAAGTDLTTELPVDDPAFDAADVYGAAGEDPLADLVVERTGEYNAVGLTNVIDAYAPLVVIVGGAVATNNESLVLDPLRERLEEMVFVNVPDVKLTTLGDDVVLVGAVASALTRGTGDRSRVPSRS